MSQTSSPPARGNPHPAGDTPAPRRRSRKLRLGLTAFGLILAAVVVLFLPRGPGAVNPVQLQLRTLTTNAPNHIHAVFMASNGWHRQADIISISVWKMETGQWSSVFGHHQSLGTVLPGETKPVSIGITNVPAPWRVEVISIVYPSRVTIWVWNVRAAVGRFLPAVDPSRVDWFNRQARTNRWPETAP